MSAIEEYRTALEYAARRDVFLTSGAVEILADAAITELEASSRTRLDAQLTERHGREQAEAELAALKVAYDKLADESEEHEVSTINPQIDAAVVLMKARAAKFNTTREMGSDETFGALTDRAIANLSRVFDGDGGTTELIDTMNLCALALSVLPMDERSTS